MARRKPEPAPAVVEQIPREETFESPEQRAAREAAAAQERARTEVAARKLTARRERFCREYVACGVGTRAALRAGYGPSYASAAVAAARLLRNVKVQRRIATLKAEIDDRLTCTAEKLLRAQMAIADADMGDVMDFTGEDGAPRLRPVHEIPPEARRAIRKWKVKRYPNADNPLLTIETVEVELEPKQPALRTLMQHKRMLEPEGSVNVHVTVTEVSRKLPEGTWAKKYGQRAPTRQAS